MRCSLRMARRARLRSSAFWRWQPKQIRQRGDGAWNTCPHWRQVMTLKVGGMGIPSDARAIGAISFWPAAHIHFA